MKTARNVLMNVFNYVSYLCYLNLLWLFGVLLGLGIFGAGPATFALINCVHRFRENQEYSTWREFLNLYRSRFLKTNGYFWIAGFAVVLSLLNMRISLVFFNSLAFLQSLYLLLIALIFLAAILFFHNYAENITDSVFENFRLTLFLLFRYPLHNITILITLFTFFFIFSEKSSLIILFGAVLFTLFFDYFHTTMLSKFKRLSHK